MSYEINWGAVISDICVMIFTLSVCIWQNDPRYLWLLAIMILTGGYKL